jgi:hypothetical protein
MRQETVLIVYQVMDNHGAHDATDTIQQTANSPIRLSWLPAHAGHFLRPLLDDIEYSVIRESRWMMGIPTTASFAVNRTRELMRFIRIREDLKSGGWIMASKSSRR